MTRILRSNGGGWSNIEIELPSGGSAGCKPLAVSDTGEVYVVRPEPEHPYYPPSQFFKYVSGQWLGPVTFDQFTADVGASTTDLVTDGSMIFAVQRSGTLYYSEDDGDTWSDGGGLALTKAALPHRAFVYGEFLYAVRGRGLDRWHIPTRTIAHSADPEFAMPSWIESVAVFPRPGIPGQMWAAATDRGKGLYLSVSGDYGLTWVSVLSAAPMPAALPPMSTHNVAEPADWLVMGSDARLHAYGVSCAEGTLTLKESSHALSTAFDWSKVATLATLNTGCDSTAGENTGVATPYRVQGVYPAEPVDVWVSVPRGTGSDIYHIQGDGIPSEPGATWTTATRGLVLAGASSTVVRNVVVSPNGGWRAVVAKTGGAWVVVRSNNGVEWENIGGRGWVTAPVIAISEGGRVFAAARGSPPAEKREIEVYSYVSGGWYGPIAFNPGHTSQWATPSELVLVGSLLVIVEEDGHVSYSSDEGSSWTNAGTVPALTQPWKTIVAGGMIHFLKASGEYARWDSTTRSLAPVAQPPSLPQPPYSPRVPSIFTRSGSTSELWIASGSSGGGLWVARSTDSGETWTPIVQGEAFPAALSDPRGFTIGTDDRLHVYGMSFAGGLAVAVESRHALSSSVGWSVPTAFLVHPASSGNGVFWTTQRHDGVQHAPVDVWVSVDQGAGKSDLLWATDRPVIPSGQTRGCAGGAHAVNPSTCMSDPVNTATGAYEHRQTDVALPGIGIPFEFVRTYRSDGGSAGSLGPGWTHSYEVRLIAGADGDMTLQGEDEQLVNYSRQSDGSYVPAAGARSTLTQTADGFELLRRDQVRYLFNPAGRLWRSPDSTNTLTMPLPFPLRPVASSLLRSSPATCTPATSAA
ncbi:MAG: DUF6531 domain-containing protein [Actinomycetota bacterium]